MSMSGARAHWIGAARRRNGSRNRNPGPDDDGREDGAVGAPLVDLAGHLRPGVLCDRDDGDELLALRRRPLRRRGVPREPASVGSDDRRRPLVAKDGAGPSPHLRPDARAQMGDLDGRRRVDWRGVRQLRARTGRRPDRSGRRVRARLPAASRVAHLRDRPAPAKNRSAEARVMDADALLASLQQAVPGAPFDPAPSVDPQTTIYTSRDALPGVARALRDRPELAFSFLAELTAADYWPADPRFELVYILVSPSNRARLRLKVWLNAADAHVATVTDVWPAANWLEREVWDLFGIVFDRHPDPRRLLMPEDWDGFPLRNDYPVQIRKTPQASEPLQVTEEEFRANVIKDRLTRG